ncbi:MAG TPA: hypothetical protein PKC18_02140 [Lacipirellulaceae bacterium]|nr:hypothetical protein [Lacipirellulaceae bacterium]
MNSRSLSAADWQEAADDSPAWNQFERITHRRDGRCPVRAHASRLRAIMRSQGTRRRRPGAINGPHRRRLHTAFRLAPV